LNRAEHRERRERHHIACHFQHDVRNLLERANDELRLVAKRRKPDAEEGGEHHDLQDFVVCHRLNNAARHEMHHEFLG